MKVADLGYKVFSFAKLKTSLRAFLIVIEVFGALNRFAQFKEKEIDILMQNSAVRIGFLFKP